MTPKQMASHPDWNKKAKFYPRSIKVKNLLTYMYARQTSAN